MAAFAAPTLTETPRFRVEGLEFRVSGFRV